LALALLANDSVARAASPNQATSSRSARDEAISSLPFDKLPGDVRDKVQSTIASTTLYRRLPVQVSPCDPDMYLFLVRHPEVVVNIWEIMQVSNVAIRRTGPDKFRATDNMGTACDIRICYSDHETQVIYAEGAYSGPMFKQPIRARCVLLLKSGYLQETDGRYFVTSRMDTFIQIEHAGLEVLAKTLQMLIHRSADYNFIETASFLSNVSQTAEANPTGMQRLAAKLTNVQPDVRTRFAEISLEVGEKARQRLSTQARAVPTSTSPSEAITAMH
jgi:hypothetical protein